MADKELIIRERLENAGLFNFPSFYGYAHSWFKEEDYGVVEEKYSEKVSGNSRDITFEWTASKKISDYFKIEHKLRFEVDGLTDVEAEIDGKKIRMHKGKVRIDIKGALIRDPESKWDEKPLTRFLRDVYNKYVIPQRVDSMREKVIADVIGFKDSIKAFLEMSGRR